MLHLSDILREKALALDWCVVDPGHHLILERQIRDLTETLVGWESYIYIDNQLLLNPYEGQIISSTIDLKTLPQSLSQKIYNILSPLRIKDLDKLWNIDISSLPHEIEQKIRETYDDFFRENPEQNIYTIIGEALKNIWFLQRTLLNEFKTNTIKWYIDEFLKKSVDIFNWLGNKQVEEISRVYVPIDDFIIIKDDKVVFRFGLGKQVHFLAEDDLHCFNSGKLDNHEWPLYLYDQTWDSPDIWMKIWKNKEFICYLNNTKYSLEELIPLWNFEWIKDLIEKLIIWIETILTMN